MIFDLVQRRRRLGIVPNFHGQFRVERLVMDFFEQHLDRALRAAPTGFFDPSDAAAKIAFRTRRADPLAARQTQGEYRQPRHRIGHSHRRLRRRQAVNPRVGQLTVGADAGIFLVHLGHLVIRELIGHRVADLHAAHAVAAGIERRPGDDDIRRRTNHRVEHRRERFVLMLVEIIVADVYRASDRRSRTELDLQGPRGTGAPVDLADRQAGLIFAAQPREKLI